ncbi:MAG: hypothetical protein B9S32_03815 [Verrucomicrobia bacterium Tous-C9LFEB]|nr:MAG: hypothetical protein B9S32_03815 [Verrucomicrobia bacterium Tous-C9LFEB]
MKSKRIGTSSPLHNAITGYFERIAFDRMTPRHYDAFIEIMLDELHVSQWIADQNAELMLKVFARAELKRVQGKAKSVNPKQANHNSGIDEELAQ